MNDDARFWIEPSGGGKWHVFDRYRAVRLTGPLSMAQAMAEKERIEKEYGVKDREA